ncbi:MAG: response regulator [Bacteroidota bacterium]|nr:response regulator [Bacteroidota bacterium]
MSRLLIVDDDPDMLIVIKSLLNKKGFKVSVFTDWDNAGEAIIEYDPQLILLDVFLSGVDGLEICKRLKTSTYTRHIPIIIFSVYPRVGETAIYEFGADDFIAKPFEVNDLVKKIHNVLSKKQESV